MKWIALFALLNLFLSNSSFAEEVRHLLVAKFALQRLEPAGLTDEQEAKFNKLSADLRAEIDTLRSEVGIDKVVMARRDEAHRELKGLKLDEVEYWSRLQEMAALNEAQLAAFKLTQEKFDTFKNAVNGLLTVEQKKRVNEAKRKEEATSLPPE